MKTKNILGAFLGCAFLATAHLHAAVISSDWNNFIAGTNSWNTAANWDSSTWTSPNWNPSAATVPNNGGTNTFAARIMNGGTSDIVVETSGAVTVGRFWLERTNTGSTTLRLGGNMTVTGTLTGPPASGANARLTGFYNNIASTPSGLVLDLNGYTFDASGAAPADLQNARNYTIRDTSGAGNGTFIVRAISYDANTVAGTVNVENNVTVKLTTYTGLNFRNSGTDTTGWIFAQNSTLWLSANGTGTGQNLNAGDSEFGNVIVGSVGNTVASVYSLGHSAGSSIHIKGDLTLNAGSAIIMNNIGGDRVGRKIFLGGNLTDTNATGADYGGRADTGGFYFVGGTNRVQEVLVKREGLTSLFSVGDSNAVANVKLLNNLTTTVGTNANSGGTGQLKVWGGSRFDVDQFTLQATTVNISNTATLAFTFGEDTTDALIKATGLLTLNAFNLELNYDGSSWSNGTKLLLFEYGTLAGTPVLSSLAAPSGMGFDGAYLDLGTSGQIWLVPEPTTLAFLLGGMGVLFLAVRRRKA